MANTRQTTRSVTGANNDVMVTDAPNHESMKEMFQSIRNEITSMRDMFTERMDSMEKSLSTKITDELKVLLTDKIHEIVTEKMVSFNEEWSEKIDSLENKVKNLHSQQIEDLSLNIAIRQLPETPNEQILDKVNGLLRDKLKLKDVMVETAVRRKSFNDKFPGIIIARY